MDVCLVTFPDTRNRVSVVGRLSASFALRLASRIIGTAMERSTLALPSDIWAEAGIKTAAVPFGRPPSR